MKIGSLRSANGIFRAASSSSGTANLAPPAGIFAFWLYEPPFSITAGVGINAAAADGTLDVATDASNMEPPKSSTPRRTMSAHLVVLPALLRRQQISVNVLMKSLI